MADWRYARTRRARSQTKRWVFALGQPSVHDAFPCVPGDVCSYLFGGVEADLDGFAFAGGAGGEGGLGAAARLGQMRRATRRAAQVKVG